MKIRRIQIDFPEAVTLAGEQQQKLVEIVTEITEAYERNHPARTMWPFGIGFLPTFIPMTREQEEQRGIEFDESVFAIEVYERADYAWPCRKCGLTQGDHKGHIVDPPAGACDFEPASKP